jgi:hypothetical protein
MRSAEQNLGGDVPISSQVDQRRGVPDGHARFRRELREKVQRRLLGHSRGDKKMKQGVE